MTTKAPLILPLIDDVDTLSVGTPIYLIYYASNFILQYSYHALYIANFMTE